MTPRTQNAALRKAGMAAIFHPHRVIIALVAFALLTAAVGCKHAPGLPKPDDETVNPDQVSDFRTLYGKNCAACHGDRGVNGASISLANPVYLAVAGEANLERVTASGVPGTLMPAFAQSAGGMLTDRQIAILARGMMGSWATPAAFAGQTLPAYADSAPGDPVAGKAAFMTYCASCHSPADAPTDAAGGSTGQRAGSLVDPAYLALVSNQHLRSWIIAGSPEEGMPNWRSHPANGTSAMAAPLTDRQIADIVAWLASHRVETPGQPYQQHP